MQKKKLLSKKIPIGLDETARLWKEYIEANIDLVMVKDLTVHVPGTHSIYHIMFTLSGSKDPQTLHYVGRSETPKTRADKHKSDIKNCTATTKIGKSKLFDKKYFEGVSKIEMLFSVKKSGLNLEQAKVEETTFADEIRIKYGNELILNNPRGNASAS